MVLTTQQKKRIAYEKRKKLYASKARTSSSSHGKKPTIKRVYNRAMITRPKKTNIRTTKNNPIVEIADPVKSDEAMNAARERGAFTIKPTSTSTSTPTSTPVTEETSTNDIKIQQDILSNYGIGTGTLKDAQDRINNMQDGEKKLAAQNALSKLSRLGGKLSQNPTSYEQAIAKTEEWNGDAAAISNEIFGDSTIPISSQDMADRMLFEQEEDKTSIENEISRLNKLDKSDLAHSGVVATHAKAASAASNAMAGGITSSNNTLLTNEYSKEVDRRLGNAKTRLDITMDRRKKLLSDLEKAQRNQKEGLAKGIAKNLASVANQIDAMKIEIANSEAESMKLAFTLFDKLPEGSLAGKDPMEVANALNIDPGLASFFVGLDTQKNEIDLNTYDGQLKMAELRIKQAEAYGAGLTKEQKNFLFAQDLNGIAKDKFLNFAGKNPTYGFTTIGNKIFATNPLTGQVQQVSGGTSGGEKLAPSGKLATAVINGKQVTLDESALFGLQTANGAATEAGLGGINVTSSTRDQKQTILQMAAQWGVEVDPDNLGSVNQAAATLTAMGHSVAAVGHSNHEFGLAIDVYPSDPASQDNTSAQTYIAKIKPYLEANGWKQSTDPSDKGHFNFVGMTIYSDEQKAVMDSINLKKYTGTSAKSLADSDLTYADLASYKKTQGPTKEQLKMIQNVKDKTRAALAAIQNIEDKKLWKAAGWVGGKMPAIWSMKPEDLDAQITTIISSIALDEMKSLKESSPTGSTGFGALSQKELDILTSSKGAIRRQMSEGLLKENLQSIKEILEKTLGITDTVATTNREITDPQEIQQIYLQLKQLQNEGYSDAELISTLESKGIDSTTFFK